MKNNNLSILYLKRFVLWLPVIGAFASSIIGVVCKRTGRVMVPNLPLTAVWLVWQVAATLACAYVAVRGLMQ